MLLVYRTVLLRSRGLAYGITKQGFLCVYVWGRESGVNAEASTKILALFLHSFAEEK